MFRVIEEDAEVVSGNDYSRVVTQDGVEVLLYSGAISDWTFQRAVGSHELIFNSPYRLCKTPGCEQIFDKQVWEVARGEAFKITQGDPGYSDRVQITATRGNDLIRGYMPGEELGSLSRSGALTRTDRRVPRYSIQRFKSDVLSTSFDEQIQAGEIQSIDDSDSHTEPLAQLLKMGKLTAEGIEIERGYGGEGYQYSFYLYEVDDQAWEADSPERTFPIWLPD